MDIVKNGPRKLMVMICDTYSQRNDFMGSHAEFRGPHALSQSNPESVSTIPDDFSASETVNHPH